MRTSPASTRRSVAAFVIGLAAVAACESTTQPTEAALEARPAIAAHVGNGQAPGGPGEVPWKSRADFHSVGTTTLTCTPMGSHTHVVDHDRYEGTGYTSHMGAATTEILFTSCATVYAPVGDRFAVFTAEGWNRITAANGDELVVDFSLTQYLDGGFDLTSITIVDGTGRFAGASGSATGSGFIDRETYVGDFTVSGTMTPPGAARHAGR